MKLRPVHSCALLLTLLFNAGAQPADIRQGLVAYWRMDTTDGVVTPDVTPFANHISSVNMDASRFVPGHFGNAASFNGTSTYLIRSHSSEDYPATGLPIYRAGKYTITMWVKGAAQTAKYLFTEGSTASATPLFILQTGQQAANNAKFDVIIRTDGNTALLNHIQSTNVVFDNNWHHIAWVDNLGQARLYVDGNLDPANFNYTPGGTFTFQTTVIGNLVRTTVATGYFNGLVDDVAVWERVLSQTEIREVMNDSVSSPIPELPPYIDVAPVSATNAVGDRVTFRARAIGNRPLNLQWYRGATPIDGATGTSLTLSNLTVADSGDYIFSVANIDGTVTATARLTVLPDPTPNLHQGLISYWPFEDQNDDGLGGLTTPDVYSRNDMALVGMDVANQVTGVFGTAHAFDGTTEYSYRVGGFPIYNNPAYTVCLWVKIAGVGQSDRRFFAESSTNNANPVIGFGTQTTGTTPIIRVYFRNDAGTVLLNRDSARGPLDGAWHHLAWTDNNGKGKLYIDGQLDETDFTYARTNLTLNQTALGALLRTPVGFQCAGSLDEVALWNRALSFTEIQQVRTNGVPAPVSALPPTITQDPVSQAVFTRSKVTFSFLATGTSPLLAQWRKNGANLSGQTNFTLFLNGVTLNDTGNYDVVVTNSAGRATSQVATLTVTLRPPPPAELKIDFNNIGGEANTESGFSSFVLPAFGPGPFRRVYGGAEVEVAGVNVTMESRLRATPTNLVDFTEERLLQDFIFARDAAAGDGLDVRVEFLEPRTPYALSLWSFDSGSPGNRISDWFANGTLVQSAYVIDRTVLPTSNDRYRFSFSTISDAEGHIVIQGRRNSGTTNAINVFLNALTATRQDLRVLRVELLPPNTLRLTIQTINPGAPHRIEEKAQVTDATWTEVPNALFGPSMGNLIEATWTLPAAAARFYRVVEGP